jgi:hypothetical protein
MKGRGLQAARPLLGNSLLTSEGRVPCASSKLAAKPAFHLSASRGVRRDMVTRPTARRPVGRGAGSTWSSE